MIDSMAHLIPYSGFDATRIRVSDLGRFPGMDPSKEILAENLNELMAKSRDLKTVKQLHAASGVSTGTIDRIRRGEVAAGVDTVRMLAAAFEMEGWQLLVPKLKIDAVRWPLSRELTAELRSKDDVALMVENMARLALKMPLIADQQPVQQAREQEESPFPKQARGN